MFHSLTKVIMTCMMAGSVLSSVGPAPQASIPAPLPDGGGRTTFRQASRAEILRRIESRRVAARAGALQPRQSPTVYPTCSSGSPGYVPQSGFVALPEYSIDTNTDNFIDGYLFADSAIGCVMLCENTPECTGSYFAGGTTCYLRKGTISGPAIVSESGTDRVALLRGDCASLEGQINNSTIMASCCNNPPPSTILRCSKDYVDIGPGCTQNSSPYTSANRVTTVTVKGGGPNASTQSMVDQHNNCLKACVAYNAKNRTGSHNGCAAASNYALGSTNNCQIYGGKVLSMRYDPSASDFYNSWTIGTCEQRDANGIAKGTKSFCYSPSSGP